MKTSIKIPIYSFLIKQIFSFFLKIFFEKSCQRAPDTKESKLKPKLTHTEKISLNATQTEPRVGSGSGKVG